MPCPSALPGCLRISLPPLFLLLLASMAQGKDYSFTHENVLGTALDLKIVASDAEAAEWAEAFVLSEIDRQAKIFSTYDSSSEFLRWQATSGTPVPISPELFEVLEMSDALATPSQGAFDPRVEALTQLWARCAREDRTPKAEEIQECQALMAKPAWRLDRTNRTAQRLSRCPLNLSAIAKGYILEKASALAFDRARGIDGILLNLGGDLRARGKVSWTIDIPHPLRDYDQTDRAVSITLRDEAMATSGLSQRGFRIKGQSYSHIFDPRTGRPTHTILSASVIARSADQADALATTFNVLTPRESVALAEATPGVECLIVGEDGQVHQSQGWARYLLQPDGPARRGNPFPSTKPNPPLLAQVKTEIETEPESKSNVPAKPAAESKAWNEDFELLVSFEIGTPKSTKNRYRRPYVAVWVENPEGLSVRTLILWAEKNARSRWVADLRRWYRSDLARREADKYDLRRALSRATRPPGQYDVIWDGKDDQGHGLPAGQYVVALEIAREHGTYQIIRKEVTLGDKPFAEDLQGNVEMKSARLDYRRRVPAP